MSPISHQSSTHLKRTPTTMVQFGLSTRPRPQRSSFPLLAWASRAGMAILAYICLSMVATLRDIEAPSHHGDLTAHYLMAQKDVAQPSQKTNERPPILQDNHREFPTDKEGDPENELHRLPRENSDQQHARSSVDTVKETLRSAMSRPTPLSGSNVTKIGFAVTITNCGSDGDFPFPITEGAAVLSYSIRRASIHGTQGGRYDYELYAIYHPDAEPCAETLQDLGYTLVKRDSPVAVKDIEGDFLRSKIEANGCCGEKELIKLEAFTFTQHSVMVILDLDALILQPLDEIFDIMLDRKPPPIDHMHRRNESLPADISIIYTLDYAMVNPGRKVKPVQGGFLVLRPNQTVYEEFREIVRVGDYRDEGGWSGKTGKFWGSMTFQGLIPYYYLLQHPGRAVEVNRCIYNNMCSNPRTKSRNVNDTTPGKCFTQEEDCEDCRARPLEDIVSAHFTVCQKPWMCMRHWKDAINHRLCRLLHDQWFLARSELEQSWGRSGWGNGTGQDRDHFHGYCSRYGERGYDLIQKPYGKPTSGI